MKGSRGPLSQFSSLSNDQNDTAYNLDSEPTVMGVNKNRPKT